MGEKQTAVLRNAQRVAVFDIDGTLYSTNTAFGFLEYFHQKRSRLRWAFVRTARHPFGKVLWAVLARVGMPFEFRRLALRSLAGARVNDVEVEASAYVATIRSSIRTEIALELERVRSRGYLLLLLSGTPQFVVDALVTELKADAGMGIELETVGDRYSGRICREVRGRKQEIVNGLVADVCHLLVASDNREDLGLLLQATEALVVTRERHASWWAAQLPCARLVRVG